MAKAGDELVVMERVAAGSEAAGPVAVPPPGVPEPAPELEITAARPQRLYPVAELTLARLREFWREPELVFWVFIFPLLLAFSLGLAFRNTGPEKIYVAVENDGGNAREAAAAAEALTRNAQFVVRTVSPAEAAAALKVGKVAIVLRPGREQVGQSAAAQPNAFSYLFDPMRPEGRVARLAVDDHLQRAAGRGDVSTVTDLTVTAPGARYIDFLIPGLLGMSLMSGGLWGVGVAVVVARTRKVLKRLASTPMRRSHYLLSFMLARLIFWVMEVTLLITFAHFVFGYVIQGSKAEMILLLLLGGVTFAGVGLLIGSRPKTMEGVSGLSNLVLMPMWLLSGTFFSSERFPEFIQPVINALPLTALNNALRAVMNDGAPLVSHWVDFVVLAIWGTVTFVVALKIFRWQ